MIVRPIQFQGPEFATWIDLRYRILRKPLGLEYSDQEIAAEKDDHHLCIFGDSGEPMIGGLILQPKKTKQTLLGGTPNSVCSVFKMRQVAVEASIQGQGVGSALVEFAEAYAWQKQAEKIVLHARETAVPFYLRLGYRITSDVFEEIGLAHFKMQKVNPR